MSELGFSALESVGLTLSEFDARHGFSDLDQGWRPGDGKGTGV